MSKKNKLTVSQKQKLEEWNKKMEDMDLAIKEGKRFLIHCGRAPFDTNEKLKEIARKIKPKIFIKKEDLNEKETELLTQVFYDFGIENGIHLADSTPEKLRGLTANLRNDLIKEFNCTTSTEKILVDTVVNAYTRNLNYSKKLLGVTEMGNTNSNINNFIGLMSKEIDRANRHFLSALQTLKEIKQPELKVNIKTNTAFFGEKQEFNNNDIKK
jgi:uncharacterized protein YunC (DUF1805 family)